MPIDEPTAEIIDALVMNVPFDGWTQSALRNALAGLGLDPADAPLIFPGGAAEMIEAFCTLCDQRMEQAAEAAELAAYRLPARVRAVIALRFEQNRGNKTAIRRAMAWLSLPQNLGLAARLTAATIDAIWHAAGDVSADISWYTKRGILAGVYTTTLLYWLRDTSDEDKDTLRFLDRRLADVARIGKIRRRLTPKAA